MKPIKKRIAEGMLILLLGVTGLIVVPVTLSFISYLFQPDPYGGFGIIGVPLYLVAVTCTWVIIAILYNWLTKQTK